MKITINPTLDLETLQWVANDGVYEYDGPVLLFQGPSSSSKANEAAQAEFYKTMTNEQQETFGQDEDLYSNITRTTLPILAAGPMQYGYSPQLDALLQGYIKDTGSKATANAVNATDLAEKQATGGGPSPTGASEALHAEAEVLGNQATATSLQNEKLSGFQAGTQLYQSALNSLTGEQQLLNPAGYASSANGAGSNATSATHLADSERTNWLETLTGGLITGVTDGLTGGLGTAVSKIGSGDFGW